jgi:cell division protein FtsL
MNTLEAPPRPFATRGGVALAPAPERHPAPRPTPAERPRHLRVVAPAERVRRRLTPATGVLLTALLFAMLFAIAIAHTLLVQGQIRLDDLDAELTTEQARYQSLRKEVAEAESPGRVVAAAHALGMVSPDDLVYLQPDAPDLAAGDAGGPPAADAGIASGHGARGGDHLAAEAGDWSTMKPLLETPAP